MISQVRVELFPQSSVAVHVHNLRFTQSVPVIVSSLVIVPSEEQLSLATGSNSGSGSHHPISNPLSSDANTGATRSGMMVILCLTIVVFRQRSTASEIRW